MADAPVVLITGCSSGIGEAAARLFAERGFRVWATMRRAHERGARLRDDAAARGWALATSELDVTDDDSVTTTVASLLAATGGRIDVLVNNAGYYCFGPLEDTSPDELRAQLETNVVGLLRVTRAVLPAMRARGEGAIVNLSSLSGLVALPVAGPYHASKWAVEALTETLRYEVAPFGIRVTCVEPGPFRTDLHTKELQTEASRRPGSPYAAVIDAYRRNLVRLPRGEVDVVAGVIVRAATHPRPKLRWRVGPTSFLTLLRRFVPDAVYGLLVGWAFGLRRADRSRGAPHES